VSCRRLAAVLLLSGSALAQTYKPAAIEQANLGVSLSQKEDYKGAVQAYRKALAIDPRLPNLYLNLGLAYFKQGDFQQALDAFQKEPRSDRTVTLIGMSQFGLGQYKQAAATLQPLSESQPDNSELSYLLAKCHLWAGQYDQAMEMFRRLLLHDPDSAPVHMLMAEALDADDREKEATEEFLAAVKANPKQLEAHFGLGYLYFKQKRYPEAERELHAELENNSEHALSIAYLGDIMMRDARREQALAMLKRAETLDNNLHVVHQDLGIYYQEEKQFDLALHEFQEAVRTAPDNYDAHYRLARIYKQMGQPANAEKEFAIVQKLHQKKDEEPLMRISGPR
jgi:tetratricopeptide (TPR) repeat protein